MDGMFRSPLPGDGPIGEAWVLSDRDDHTSVVAEGDLKGKTIAELTKEFPEEMLGRVAKKFSRFPLLLKFLDAKNLLSVQVHPSDKQTEYLPAGEHGKTEAWVVLETGENSVVYGGLKPGATSDDIWRGTSDGTVAEHLASFTPNRGDGIFLEAGTVHTMGDVVVFEVQENSDVTFRLFDWGHIDPYTNLPRALQVAEAMACIDFERGAVGPVVPTIVEETPVLREKLFSCEFFETWRLTGESPFMVGAAGAPRVIVFIDGKGMVDHDGATYDFEKGDVVLLPAAVGACFLRPSGQVAVLEVSLPDGS